MVSKNLFDTEISRADIATANRLREKIRTRYSDPLEMFDDMARRDPSAYALVQHYFKEAVVQDEKTGLLMMVECAASIWALVRELRDDVKPKEMRD